MIGHQLQLALGRPSLRWVVEACWPPGHHRRSLRRGWYAFGGSEPLTLATAEAVALAVRSLGGRSRLVELSP